ncbi:AzlD family protein [Leisingera sp. ANG-S5]|uniref:AzlD family protein n=1 Tax=Leisingera sp. ANG-S5 TaxID=1577901 RepID=UPI00057FBDED|nr:AzlD domain-containing protein [Leisingera sp. ANG-S5]KIC33064.1 branched-chain amino acid transporter [Leisingera sp. ANG-S5]
MTETWTLILGLATATFAVRLSGYLLGRRLPDHGPWARGLQALPGCLILSLVTYLLMQGGPDEWIAGTAAFMVALITRSLPLTMGTGIAVICLLRAFF